MPQNTALCYLLDQVNNFIFEPWRFTEEGCEIRATEELYPTIHELPTLLEENGYTYLWVYKTNEYLADSLETLFRLDISEAEMTDGQLFRVVFQDGHAEGLELVKSLNREVLPQETSGETEEEAIL